MIIENFYLLFANRAEKEKSSSSKHIKHEAAALAEHAKSKKVDTVYDNAEAARQGFFTNGHQYGQAHGDNREGADEQFQEFNHESSKHRKSSYGES